MAADASSLWERRARWAPPRSASGQLAMTGYTSECVLDMLKTDHRFGSSKPFSIGVEEELFLVDPLTGCQTNTSAAVLERRSCWRWRPTRRFVTVAIPALPQGAKLLERLLEAVRPHAAALGCAAGLEPLADLASETGAARQLRVARDDERLDHLVACISDAFAE